MTETNVKNKEIFSKNLDYYMKKKGVDRNTLCADLNLKYTTVRDWLKGITYPRIGKIELLANYFNVNKSDLIEDKSNKITTISPKINFDPRFKTEKQEGIDDSLISQINTKVTKLHRRRQKKVLTFADKQLKEQELEVNNQNTVNEPQTIYYTYNYYDQALSAGTGQYLNDVQVEQIELPINIDADFVVPICGDSMEPEYHSGDYVFVKLSVDLSSGDIGVFEYYGDAYIKELVINDSGAYLHSLNPKYDDILVDIDSDFRIIGEVVGKYRED